MTRRRDPELQRQGLCTICRKPLPPPVRKGGRPRAFHDECRNDRTERNLDPELVTPETRVRNGKICGAQRINKPGVCCQPAGWGTDHPGSGRCKRHGGCTPVGIGAAAKERLLQMLPLYGAPDLNITPADALLLELRRTAGHVNWLGSAIQQFGLDRIEQDPNKDPAAAMGAILIQTMFGMAPSVVLKMYQDERDRLAKVAKMAIDAGVAERAVRVIEEQGQQIAMLLRSFIMDPDLELTPAQQARANDVMRKHLLSVNAIEANARELTERTASAG